MAKPQDFSTLRIPEQTLKKSWFDPRPKRIKQWLEALPLGDTDESANRLHSVLEHTNKVKISAPTRLKMLKELYPTYLFCTQALKKKFLNVSFPLNNRALKTVDQTLALDKELAIAYRICCVDLLTHSHFFDKKAMAHAFFMELHINARTQLTHYQIYSPEPTDFWEVVYALYRLAEQKNVHTLSIKTLDEQPRLSTVENQFKQILLLSLANPYHLGKNEITKVHALLNGLASYSKLINPETENQGDAHFVTCLTKDRPPQELHLVKLIQRDECRFLDNSALIKQMTVRLNKIQKELSQQASQLKQNDLRLLELYRGLVHNWGIRSKRSFTRQSVSGEVDMSIGLNSTHYVIDACQQDPLNQENDSEQISLTHEELENPLDIIHTTFSLDPMTEDATTSHWNKNNLSHINLSQVRGKYTDQDIPQPKYDYTQWKTLNAGAGGYCLLWDHDRSSHAQIGEIIALRDSGENNDQNWRVGVVRWMQYIRQSGVKLGIQILSPGANSIQSRLLQDNKHNAQEYSCLSLPALTGIKQPASLLTPSMQYKVGDALILNDHGKLSNVHLTRMIEMNANYSRFEYNKQQFDEQAATKDQKNDDNPEG
jgi:hypothetical protein